MKMNHAYTVDYATNTITVTKKFLKEAGSDISSEAYRVLKALRTDLPNFQIVPREIEKKEGKQSYGKLTYDAMREQIKLRETKETVDAVLAEFETTLKLSKVHAGAYAFVKKWFLARYKKQIEAEAKFDRETEETNEQASKMTTPVLTVVG